MMDLDHIPKQYFRKIRWTLFWGLFILAIIFSHYTNAAAWLFIGSLAVLGVSIKKSFRWVLPIVLILLVAGSPQLGLISQGLLIMLVVGLRELFVMPHAKITQLKQHPRLKINKSGLTRRDSRVFKQTFKPMQKSAWHVKVLFQQTVGLRRIAIETKVVTYIEAILNKLAEKPTQLLTVNDFAYRRLPNLEQLLVSYVEIANHSVISDEDKKQLKTARQLIKELSMNICKDYRLVISEDMNNLNSRMNTTKDTLGDRHE
ncbi:5-bromo-4-chloroindolyl phosphate hydrolysis family protein [Weissella paramesenteroides]|uniref:5-bromo-4-chloroindolyl phosphate hydrolysis family protein n=1 Tax=Weissella paramesenteroides TaxID=1249 RepID=UPI00123C1793|nr:5-bromo-4-chloroindolyl phosphate hydrolysis family protein [Weissella paramesenteroides]KAA8457478.1 5-bromo-4-chloroindolyl phosphate hydrolase [Weissella paramesenteroides]KAA8458941.1 5-bromo-4-chloroindolyl phosphate hydrolase [Weissella paramesenteroides]KAA8460616.1 5-bromo-4-chloroindolyl phosphate hydrolase [Weissella paramesenteroides]KAA8460841.1 5-bromo-4-chloroindolyl phosphate hydrolase [Weissella paramesenteroides]KAA8462594.1 5-bromo-4-chloroindolyl phosphate hydrolase [Weis